MSEVRYDKDDTKHLLKDYEPDEDIDDDAARQSLNRAPPFRPGPTSTPYDRGDEIEMKMMHHENTWLPSYAETSFGGEAIPSVDELSRRLADLTKNSITGILDVSEIPNTKENL